MRDTNEDRQRRGRQGQHQGSGDQQPTRDQQREAWRFVGYRSVWNHDARRGEPRGGGQATPRAERPRDDQHRWSWQQRNRPQGGQQRDQQPQPHGQRSDQRRQPSRPGGQQRGGGQQFPGRSGRQHQQSHPQGYQRGRQQEPRQQGHPGQQQPNQQSGSQRGGPGGPQPGGQQPSKQPSGQPAFSGGGQPTQRQQHDQQRQSTGPQAARPSGHQQPARGRDQPPERKLYRVPFESADEAETGDSNEQEADHSQTPARDEKGRFTSK